MDTWLTLGIGIPAVLLVAWWLAVWCVRLMQPWVLGDWPITMPTIERCPDPPKRAPVATGYIQKATYGRATYGREMLDVSCNGSPGATVEVVPGCTVELAVTGPFDASLLHGPVDLVPRK